MSCVKYDLINSVISYIHLDEEAATRIVDAMFDTIRDRLAEGEDVHINGFGFFELHDKAARPGRNPRTNERRMVGPRRIVRFRAGVKLRERIKDCRPKEIRRKVHRDILEKLQ